MKKLLVSVLLTVFFLVACAPAAKEVLSTPTQPVNGWGGGWQQPQWSGSWNQTQSEQTSEETITTPENGVRDPGHSPMFSWWIIGWFLYVLALLISLFYLIVWLINKTKIRRDALPILIEGYTRKFFYVLLTVLAVPLALTAQQLAFRNNWSESWMFFLPVGILTWSFVTYRVGYWVFKKSNGQQEKREEVIETIASAVEAAESRLEKEQSRNQTHQKVASLTKKLQVAKETKTDLELKLDDIEDQAGQQARRLNQRIREKGQEISRLEVQLGDAESLVVKSQREWALERALDVKRRDLEKTLNMADTTSLRDASLDLDGAVEPDTWFEDILEAIMAPWMFSVGRLWRVNRLLIQGIKFDRWLWVVSIAIPTALYLWLGNPGGVLLVIISILVILAGLAAVIAPYIPFGIGAAISRFSMGLLKLFLEVVEAEVHAERTVRQIQKATDKKS